MKRNILIAVAALVLVSGSSAMAQYCYRSAPALRIGVSFGSAYPYPQPVYSYCPPPVYRYRPACPPPGYYAPVAYPPMQYASAPAYSAPARAVVAPPCPIVLQTPPGFSEVGRRYHGSGSDRDEIDWVEGTTREGQKLRIYFNRDGTPKKQKPIKEFDD